MARLPRLVVPHQPHHVIQRGLDQQAIFRDADDHLALLEWLREGSKKFKVAIHAYVLMPGYWCLLATPLDEDGLARMMQWVGRYYVPYFNNKYSRSGTLWQGRYMATVIDAEPYLMLCSRYVELAPVYDGLAAEAVDYRWSSYAHHIGLRQDSLITDHRLYWSLGNTPFDREAAYKDLAERALTSDEISLLKDATSKSWALGSDKFKSELEKLTRRRVSPARRGRPAKGEKTQITEKEKQDGSEN